ncbi:MAG: hypothetical protein QOG35_2904 [Solirubrobacteraceae bacterium]|jgi:hypothetical protein|nr:hypothetical protein [Solirubrobacteraceae bacterium]
MAGSVFFGVLVLAILLVAVVGATPFLFIPAILIAFGALALGPLLAALRGSSIAQREPGPDVPSSREAAYDPTEEAR